MTLWAWQKRKHGPFVWHVPPICITMLLQKLRCPNRQRAPNPPEFAHTRLSRSNGGHPQREGTQLGVFVPVWLVLPRCEATNLGVFVPCHFALLNQRKTKGQQLKGKIVSEFFTLFHNFWHFFIIFPRLSPSKQRVLAQGEQKRRKDNKKKRANRFCTLVVARLSSSNSNGAVQIRAGLGARWKSPAIDRTPFADLLLGTLIEAILVAISLALCDFKSPRFRFAIWAPN